MFSLFRMKARHGQTRDDIPSLYTGYLGSWLAVLNRVSAFHTMIQGGYEKYRGGLYKHPQLSNVLFLVTGRYIAELVRAPDNVLSLFQAVDDVSRELDGFFPSMYEEVVHSCGEELEKAQHEPQNVRALPFALGLISRISNRAFVGLPLSRNEELIELELKFTAEVVKASEIISIFPVFLKSHRSEGESLLIDINRSPHSLYHIASKPEYVEPLRQEIAEVVHQYGWSKEGLDQMYKLDSFMKECARYSGLGSLGILRKCVTPFVFSDGSRIPSGASVAVPMTCVHLDPDNYIDALEFRGFRFLSRDSKPDLLVSTS
ncbi:cytochrome P450 [Mycena vulgaris]|nr:cytochrome P450 [Mycena vulgaris]